MMKKKKLHLKKFTIHSFAAPLNGDEHEKVRGGSTACSMQACTEPGFCPHTEQIVIGPNGDKIVCC